MPVQDTARHLLVGLTVVILSAGCAGGVSSTPTIAPTVSATATPAPIPTAEPTITTTGTPPSSPTPAPARTPVPTWTPGPEPTIGEPADDGARVIAVDANPTDLMIPSTRARDLTIDSPAVGHPVQVRLLLPGQYDAEPTTHWPVLYLLGGQSGTHTGWTQYMDVEALTAPTDLLVVMPDAGADDPNGASFTDWWNGGRAGPRQWETFHLVELRQLLERNWHAGDKRAIAGASAGGYGAMEYAARQPGMFRFAGSYSGGGLHEFVGPSSGPEPADKWGSPAEHPDIWAAHDPYVNAAKLEGTVLFVAYGNGKPGALDNYAVSPWDPTGEAERYCAADSAAFLKRLGDLDIPVTVFAYGNGTHGAAYFSRDLKQSLPLILAAVGE